MNTPVDPDHGATPRRRRRRRQFTSTAGLRGRMDSIEMQAETLSKIHVLRHCSHRAAFNRRVEDGFEPDEWYAPDTMFDRVNARVRKGKLAVLLK